MSASARASESRQHGKTNVTSKPWFVTFNEENDDVFVWKNGLHLKLANGKSAGCVREVCVLNQEDKTISVSDCINYCLACVHTFTSKIA